MTPEWKLVKDDKVHWHYEQVENPRAGWCCEFMDQQRTCMDCEDRPIWHASMRCPICRGPGIEKQS